MHIITILCSKCIRQSITIHIASQFASIYSQRQETDIISICIYFDVKLRPQGRSQIRPQGHILNNFDRGPLDDAIYMYQI